jgi:GNAT superfamily N-acetyltransferase
MSSVENIRIVPYSTADNEYALILEEQCVQGESLSLKFRRPTFHARSEVYEKYKILCAKVNNSMVGIIAGAEKFVRLRNEIVRTIYIYDLRVHPGYRKQGMARRLASALLECFGEADCIYSLIAGKNKSALIVARRVFDAQVVLPLTYVIIPVYKKQKEEIDFRFSGASEVHETYIRLHPDIKFVPAFDEKSLVGYISSITLLNIDSCGFSFWTNKNLLEEQVVNIPFQFRLMRLLMAPFHPFLKLPHIPKPGEIIQSWFLFDFCATDKKSTQSLLTIANNIAFDNDRTFLYLLLRNNDITLRFIKNSGFMVFTVPYFFLAKGRNIPAETDQIYIDIRDL